MFKKKKLKSIRLEDFLASKLKSKKSAAQPSKKVLNIENPGSSENENNEGYYYYDGNNWRKIKIEIFKHYNIL